MSNYWQMMEGLPDLAAVVGVWKQQLGDEFERYKNAFMERSDWESKWVRCPVCEGDTLEVVKRSDGSIAGVARCEEPGCEDVALTLDDLVIWQWSWRKAGRALAKAFGCDAKVMDLGMMNTWQVAELGGSRLPIVVTIQLEPGDLRGVVGELVGRMRTGFVLLAPTGMHHNARIQELLSHAKAGFFDLASTITVLPNGDILARKFTGELFETPTPQPSMELTDEDLRKIYGRLLLACDAEEGTRKGSLKRVFDLYCMAGCSAEQAAIKLNCSKGTIINRLDALEKRTGVSPDQLRSYKPVFEEIEKSLSDPRAKRIRRQGAAYGDDPDGNDCEY